MSVENLPAMETDAIKDETLKPMAFTIHFADNKDVPVPKQYAARHRRIPSLPDVEENKKSNSVQAIGLSPLPMRKVITARRAGYHSEGYFSSDQDDDLFVKKFKNLDKGLRTTNLAQEKKIMAEHKVRAESCEFGDFPEDKIAYDEAGVDSKRHNTSLNNLNVLKPEEWLAAAVSDEEEVEEEEEEEVNELNDIDTSNDTVSEAGTYTIDKDAPCPDVDQARLEIEKAIISSREEKSPDDPTPQEEDFKMSGLYRDGSNWINEWATQVAKHNNKGLPPLPLGKHHGQVVLTRIPSPVHSPCIAQPPSRRLQSSPNHAASPLHMQEGGERHSDSSLETESFLRATESVVTAMQARMSLSLDSGGESDVDTSHSYQAPPSSTAGASTGDRHLTFRRPSVTPQSDSSSDTGDSKAKRKDTPTTASAPQMRYNRAFSLRRARLDVDEPNPAPPASDNRRKKSDTASSTVTSKVKKAIEPAKSVQAKNTGKPKTPKNEAFSRTDCGRFSVRTSKTAVQAPHNPKPVTSMKKDVNKKPGSAGARSNSTLSSREVEFQNWKRRKSYDPMKAAAEGKKKEAAKKATFSTSMTQSTIVPSETSPPSMQNPVLRSASFHGTAGLTPKYISSEEEEVTLSADEDSPTTGQCLLPAPASPSKRDERFLTFTRSRPSHMEGAFGGSRASLYSNASNSSLRGRNKMEALDSLVMAAVCGLSNKLRASSCNLLKKLRYLYEEDTERTDKLSAVIQQLEDSGSPQSKSPSKELSGTLKNLKRMENVFKVLDEVLFDEEDFDLELEEY